MGSHVPNNAYATLITRSSYLAGVVLLAYSLRKHGSQYPLVVLYTSSLPATAVDILKRESKHTNMIPNCVEALKPGNNQTTYLIATRFADTWTKLRVFSEPLFKYDMVCYLDADMMIFNHNMDVVFDALDLPGDEWLGATQICCCNWDGDEWAPATWTPENCPYTPLSHPSALTKAMPVKDQPGTYADLNGGMFIFRPSEKLWTVMLDEFNTSDKLGDYKFPDQDFLADFFKNRWIPMPWRFNALKTHRYWHPNIWRDDEVVCLHYIVDKPWAVRVGEDGKAGYKARDGDTHLWWWAMYELWIAERKMQKDVKLVGALAKHVARPLAEQGSSSEDEDMLAIGSGVQALAKSKKLEKTNGSVGNGEANGHAKGDNYEAIFKNKPSAEKRHGPVIHSSS